MGESSSPTLWATASKEWIIPAKPKPGRKPKKDAAPLSKMDGEQPLDGKGRRVQNRVAQRAFRERRQSQLAELQARVQAYERGEIERNFALQNVAKRLKEENEQLRQENGLLKEKIKMVDIKRDRSQTNDRKRSRDHSLSSSSVVSPQGPLSKRMKTTTEPSTSRHAVLPTLLNPSYAISPPSMVSSPDCNGSDSTDSSIYFRSPPRDMSFFPSHGSTITNILEFPQNVKACNFDSTSYNTFDCGFCNDNTPCVCREIALQAAADEDRVHLPNSPAPLKMENFEPTNSVDSCDDTPPLACSSSPAPISVLENLPVYQPPVPIRRRVTNAKVNSIFPVKTARPSCSGDPNNCAACADDSFGRAFCEALVAAKSSFCSKCPRVSNGCCGNPSQNCVCAPSAGDNFILPLESDSRSSDKTIPTDDAWRQLKSHPNVAFTDLSLLADVVARRSKCTGPRVIISPPPGSFTSERSAAPPSPVIHSPQMIDVNEKAGMFRNANGFHGRKDLERSSRCSPSPQLVPQEVLIRCGRQTVREVHTEAVAEALRLLDAKFA